MRLSVVVTVVDGGEALRRCLAALAAQRTPPEMEVLVPLDATAPGAAGVVAEFPGARALHLGTLPTEAPPLSPSGQHELFDLRRAAGIRASRGELVAILEDRGAPRPEWARAVSDLHEALPHAVIGGAVEKAPGGGLLDAAVYLCDFGRYRLPLDAGPAAWVTDVNVSYKRRVFDAHPDAWQPRYHETTFHWALRRAGETLHLDPRMVVEERRDGLRLGALLRERFVWGRLFGFTRAREASAARRAALVLLSPLVPLVLFLRLVAAQVAKPRGTLRFLVCVPAILLLLATWCLGEAVGTATGRP